MSAIIYDFYNGLPITPQRKFSAINMLKAINNLKGFPYIELTERKILAALNRADRACLDGDLEGESDEIAYANGLRKDLVLYKAFYGESGKNTTISLTID